MDLEIGVPKDAGTYKNGDGLGVGAPDGLNILALSLHGIDVPRIAPQSHLVLLSPE